MCETVICLVTVPNVEESGELGGNFHNRYGSYLGWTGRSMVNSSIFSKRWTRPPRWTRPSLVRDGRDHLGRLALLKWWWVRFHEVLSVHRRTRLARTLGTFTSPIWFVVACLSLDETYGRVMELDDFCDTISCPLVHVGRPKSWVNCWHVLGHIYNWLINQCATCHFFIGDWFRRFNFPR